MRVKIEPSKAKGKIKAPPSKSMAHRLLICAGLSDGESIISNVAFSEDILATIESLKSLGAKIEITNDAVKVKGIDPFKINGKKELFARESGSTLRFFIPICLLTDEKISIFGSEKLLKRPLSVYEDIAKEQDVLFLNDGEKITLKGKLRPGIYKVKGNISSQFISGLLFALSLLDGDSKINIAPPIESRSYIDLTINALSFFGVEIIWEDEKTLYIKGSQKYKSANVEVEGDYSNSAFLSSLNYLSSDIEITGLNPHSLQGDKVYEDFFEKLTRGTPSIHISDCPDLGPVLFAFSACFHGGIFTGTKRLKIKESDRAKAMADELKKFGVNVKVEEDSVVVYPLELKKPTQVLLSHNDHRIVMALCVLLTKTGGEIQGAEAVSKSYPDFFDVLKSLGIKVNIYADN